MTDERSSLPRRVEARANGKARRAKRVNQEASFDLVGSGYSYQPIATAPVVGLGTFRRQVDKALAEQPLHAARPSKALRHADIKLAHGDIRAFAPYMKLVAAIDRPCGLGGRLGLPRATQSGNALTQAAEPVVPPLPLQVARFGAQEVEIARASIDIASLAGREARPWPWSAPILPSRHAHRKLGWQKVARFGAQDFEIAAAPNDIARSFR